MPWFADLILVAHVLIAAFITLGFVVIPLGAWFDWALVRRRGWRLAHLAGNLFVAAESVLGVACPLTTWEERLRGGGYEAGFIATWLRWILYYNVPLWVFGIAYVAAAILAVLLWWWVPPRAQWRVPPRSG